MINTIMQWSIDVQLAWLGISLALRRGNIISNYPDVNSLESQDSQTLTLDRQFPETGTLEIKFSESESKKKKVRKKSVRGHS